MGSELAEANTLIMLARIDAMREKKGVEYCRRKVMGPLRTSLGPLLPENVKKLDPLGDPARGNARHLAARILAQHCLDCGQCKLGRE